MCVFVRMDPRITDTSWSRTNAHACLIRTRTCRFTYMKNECREQRVCGWRGHTPQTLSQRHLLAEDYDLRRNFRPYVRLETVTMSKNRRAESYNWN
jgi:hypothetical protein